MPTDHGKRIYIAGPLSADTVVGVNKNVDAAMKVFHHIVQAGHYPFIPHVSVMLDRMKENKQTYEAWMHYDFVWLCQCNVVYRMPGVSPGADREVEYASSMGISTYYDLNQMFEALS